MRERRTPVIPPPMNRLIAASLVVLFALGAAATANAQKVYTGKLQVRHSDDFRHGRGQTTWTLRTAGGRRIPVLPTSPTKLRSGTKVTVRGRKVGRWLEGQVRRRGGPQAHAATALGDHKVAVVLINFASDSVPEPWTPAQVNSRMFTDPDSTAAFYNEQSGGDVTVSGDVFGWYRIAGPTAGCDVDLWAQQARDAVTADGKSLAGYDNVMFVFPDQASCNWAGLGELPGSQTWLNGDIRVRVAAHELGHNFGLHHASSYYCTKNGSAVTWSTSCSASEYGDPFDVMGLNARHSNAWHLAQLGIVKPADVQEVSASGTYNLRSSLTSGSGAELLRIPTPGSPARYYDLSIRQTGGVFDNYLSTAPIVNGVSIHWDRDLSSMSQSLLLDAVPSTANSFGDSPLAQGKTFTDGNTSITVTSVTPGSATVSVVLNAHVDVDPPSQPSITTARGVQGGADLVWTTSTDNVGVAGYRVMRDDALALSTTGTSWSDRGLVPGSAHKYQVVAFDAAGNTSNSPARYVTVPNPPAPSPPAASPPTTATDPGPTPGAGGGVTSTGIAPDTVAPLVRLLSPASGARLRRSARIFASATDAVGVVRIDLIIDGARVATVRNVARLRRTWRLKRVRAGLHVIRVRAFDAAGNSATRVIRVRVLPG